MLRAAAADLREPVAASLKDPDPGVRAAAVRALTRIGGLTPQDWEAVFALTRDPHQRVREAATRAVVGRTAAN
jgi:HEAT repeat protein